MEKSKYFPLIDMFVDLFIHDIERDSLISLPDGGFVIKMKRKKGFLFFYQSSILVRIWSNKLNISVKLEYFENKSILEKWNGSSILPSETKKTVSILDFKKEIVSVIEGS